MRPGDVFAGRYVLKEVIGAGRSGDVWLAHDTVVGQDVALKPERIEGEREAAVRRLLGEPRAMAKFRDHPHVVTLFDVVTVPGEDTGEDKGEGTRAETYWFVMEYVPGGGLDRQPPMSPERAARVGAELADALAALHDAGIVHCDVKPANVGLTRRGTAKLLDFGAAYRSGGTETVTVNGPFSFTPDYAAPELARGNIPRPPADVFCLGATLHALVTGSPPRGGPVDAEHGDAHGGEHGEDTARLTYWKAEQGVVEIDADAVGPLYPVLAAMLRRDPRQRPDAAEAGRLLAAVAGSQREGGDGETLRRRWPLLAAVAAVAAMVLGLGMVVLPDDDANGTRGTRAADDRGRLGEEPAEAEHGALIGDPHTADVCALTDREALGQFGRAWLDADYGNFDRCDVLIQVDDETRIDVETSLRTGSPPETSEVTETVGGIGIMEDPDQEEGECWRLVLPPGEDDVVVGIQAEMGEGAIDPLTLCTVAETAARNAAETLSRGPLPRLSPGYPDESLAWLDACSLLDAQALAVVDGLEVDDPEVSLANWSCEWRSDVDELRTELAFHREQPPLTPADGTPVRISGYDAFVEEEGNGEETCTVFVEYREYGGRNAQKAVEVLRLHVEGERPMDELCRMATDLATSAAAELRAR